MQAGGASDGANAQTNSSANAQAISQQQYQDTVNRNAPFTQAGYGALSALDYGLGINPQTAGGQPVGTSTPNGIDPSSGYHIGAGGQISQVIPGGSGISSLYSGNHGPYGSIGPGGLGYPTPSVGQNGFNLGTTPNVTGTQGMPASGPAGSVAPAGQTGGLGYGSLTKAFDTGDWQQLSPAYNFQKQQGLQ